VVGQLPTISRAPPKIDQHQTCTEARKIEMQKLHCTTILQNNFL